MSVKNSSGTSALHTGHCLVLIIDAIAHCTQQLCKQGSDTGCCKSLSQTAQSLLLKREWKIIYLAMNKLFSYLQPKKGEQTYPCVRYFWSNIYIQTNDSPLKTIKNAFLFHLKSSFCSWDIQVFVFPFSPLFLPVSHCLEVVWR